MILQFSRESFSKAGSAAFAIKTPWLPEPKIVELQEFLIISSFSEAKLQESQNDPREVLSNKREGPTPALCYKQVGITAHVELFSPFLSPTSACIGCYGLAPFSPGSAVTLKRSSQVLTWLIHPCAN